MAGIIKQYSKKAIPQLISIIIGRDAELSRNFKFPYQAKVIKTFEIISSKNGQNFSSDDICISPKALYVKTTELL